MMLCVVKAALIFVDKKQLGYSNADLKTENFIDLLILLVYQNIKFKGK